MLKYIFCILLGSIILFIHVSAQEFTSPRATALGAYTAVSNDVYGVDWNLAATSFANTKLEISFASGPDIEGFEDFRIIWRPWKWLVLSYKQTPSFMVIHIIQKHPIYFPPETPLDLLRALVYKEDRGVGYAIRFSPQAAFGMDIRRHNYLNIFSISRYWSLNLSFYLKINQKINFGIIAHNFYNYHYKKPTNRIEFYKNGSLQVIPVDFESFQSVFSSPEFRVNFGLAIRPWKRFLIAIDYFSDGGYGAGFEWQVFNPIFLRMGKSKKSDRLFKLKKVPAYSGGIGVVYKNIRLDLSYYFPYGGHPSGFEETRFGNFSITTSSRDILMLSLLFSIQ